MNEFLKKMQHQPEEASFLENNLEFNYIGKGGIKSQLFQEVNTGELFHYVDPEIKNVEYPFAERLIPMLTKGIINTSDTVYDKKN